METESADSLSLCQDSDGEYEPPSRKARQIPAVKSPRTSPEKKNEASICHGTFEGVISEFRLFARDRQLCSIRIVSKQGIAQKHGFSVSPPRFPFKPTSKRPIRKDTPTVACGF